MSFGSLIPFQAAQPGQRHGHSAEIAQLPLLVQLQPVLEQPLGLGPVLGRPLAEFFGQGIHDPRQRSRCVSIFGLRVLQKPVGPAQFGDSFRAAVGRLTDRHDMPGLRFLVRRGRLGGDLSGTAGSPLPAISDRCCRARSA